MTKILGLDTTLVAGLAQADLMARLQRILGSVEFELVPDRQGFRILGPAVPYHLHDPFLASALTSLRPDLRIEDAQTYRQRLATFDLCLEDSWSGFFVSERMRRLSSDDDLVFVHLDHHTDMMPLLLESREGRLLDATDGLAFDVHDETHWAKAIATGAVGIGTFVTALYYLRNRLHVRHVNNFANSSYSTYEVRRSVRQYPEVPGTRFASIRKLLLRTRRPLGTYRGGSDPARVLADMPAGRAIVHVDLDYLVNDFNGNPPADGWTPDRRDRRTAAAKIDAVVEALLRASISVERWIVATSPGFCSAFHWPWLLEQVEHAAARVPAARTSGQHSEPSCS